MQLDWWKPSIVISAVIFEKLANYGRRSLDMATDDFDDLEA